VGHTSLSVAGRPGQRRIWPRTEPGQKHWGLWLLGLAVLIAIMMLMALTSDLPAPKLFAVVDILPSPSQRAQHVQLQGDASDWVKAPGSMCVGVTMPLLACMHAIDIDDAH
jgi:hypothetical protein